jgi:hypothetical protein
VFGGPALLRDVCVWGGAVYGQARKDVGRGVLVCVVAGERKEKERVGSEIYITLLIRYCIFVNMSAVCFCRVAFRCME